MNKHIVNLIIFIVQLVKNNEMLFNAVLMLT